MRPTFSVDAMIVMAAVCGAVIGAGAGALAWLIVGWWQ